MDFDKPAVLKLPIVLRQVEVSRVEKVSPTLQRVWFTGEELNAFSKDGWDLPPFRSEGADDHVKFFFPSVDGTLALPKQADGTIDWPRNPRPVARDYTPRAYRQGDKEVAFDFVLHGHGVASTWAASAKPGDRLHLAGPKASLLVPKAGHFVLIGDQTALPALCNWLEVLGPETRVDALIWVDDAASRVEIETKAQANISWIVDASPDGEQLLAAVRTLPRPNGNSFVWGAMEASVLRKVRAFYIDECELDRGQLDMAAYWRRGVGDDQILAEAFRLNEMSNLEKPFLVRAVVEMRLADLVGEGVDTLGDLARRAGVNADALARLLPALVEMGVFKRNGDKLSLGLAGDLLTSPFRRAIFSSDTAQGRLRLAARGLPHFLRTGESAYTQIFGNELDSDAAEDRAMGEELGHELGHMVDALVGHALGEVSVAAGENVHVVGTGAEAVLMTLLKDDPGRTGSARVPNWALEEASEHMEEAGLSARANILGVDDAMPAHDALVISAIGAVWTDEAVASAVASSGARDVWLIELVARPDSAEIAEDAMMLDLAFGLRPTNITPLTDKLSARGVVAKSTTQTRTGLRLTRFSAS